VEGTHSVTCSGHAAKLVRSRVTSQPHVARTQPLAKRPSLPVKGGPLVAQATATAYRAAVGISHTGIGRGYGALMLLEVLRI